MSTRRKGSKVARPTQQEPTPPNGAAAAPAPGKVDDLSFLHPMKRLGIKTFERDREKLLAEGHDIREWVAYHGERLVAISKNDLDLFKKCAEEGIPLEEVYFHTLHEIVRRVLLLW